MSKLASLALSGLPLGAMYALQAMGIVLVYKTSGVFNFAQGAIGMVAAFLAAQLGVHWGWPVPLAVVAAVGFGALIGIAMELTSVRWVKGPLQKTVVTLAWLLGLQAMILGVAAQSSSRPYLDVITPDSAFVFTRFGLFVAYGWNQLAVIVLTVVLALALGAYFRTSAFGVAMRAVADAPEGAQLLGINVNKVTLVSWALGCGMGALAGVLVTPLLGRLDTVSLIIFTIQALAAALIGRLSSLPLTLAGGIVLGMSQPIIADFIGRPAGSNELIALVFILGALLTRKRTGRGDSGGGGLEPVPFGPMPKKAATSAAIGLFAAFGAWTLFGANPGNMSFNLTILFIFALGTLSIVLLSGIAGQVSLCQASFMGVGGFAAAIAYNVLGNADGSIGLGAFLITVLIGGLGGAFAAVLVGVPALRLQGLELAIVTLSLAFAADRYFFAGFKPLVGPETRRDMAQPFTTIKADVTVGESTFQIVDGRPYAFLAFILFLVLAFWVASLRRGRTGAAFTALRSSIAATSAMGFSAVSVKLKGFALSGFIAGIGGALYAGLTSQAGSAAFMFDRSITLLAYAVIVGLGSVPGAFLGGLIVMIQSSSLLDGDGTDVVGNAAAFFDVGTAVLLVVVLIFAPRGLTGILTDLRARFRRTSTDDGDDGNPAPAEAPLVEAGVG